MDNVEKMKNSGDEKRLTKLNKLLDGQKDAKDYVERKKREEKA